MCFTNKLYFIIRKNKTPNRPKEQAICKKGIMQLQIYDK